MDKENYAIPYNIQILVVFLIVWLILIPACSSEPELPSTPSISHPGPAAMTEAPTETGFPLTSTQVATKPGATASTTPKPIVSPTETPTTLQITVSVEPGLMVEIPEGNPPEVDGRLSEGEWDEAVVVSLTDGGQLYMMHAGGYLFLGLLGDGDGIGSVCRYEDGEVSILHASAAMNTYYYAREEDHWRLKSMVIGTYNLQLPESLWQEQHLEDYGWTASVFDDGNAGEYEYQISLEDGEAILAAAYVDGFGENTLLFYELWPGELGDDCGRMEIAAEGLDIGRLQFSPETWVKLIAMED